MIRQMFFTADTFFGCEVSAEQRGYSDADDMDDALREAWNKQVDHDDVVWVLGGFATSTQPPHPSVAGSLNGVKYLVAGPTDPVFHMSILGEKHRDIAIAQWRTAGFRGVVTGSGIAKRTGRPVHAPLRGWSDGMPRSVVVSALPFTPPQSDEHMLTQDRFAKWRPRRGKDHAGRPLWGLHGGQTDWVVSDTQINVGMDVWGLQLLDAATLVALIEDDEGAAL